VEILIKPFLGLSVIPLVIGSLIIFRMKSFLFLCAMLAFIGNVSAQIIKLGSDNQNKDQLLIIQKDKLKMLIDSKGNIQDRNLPFLNNGVNTVNDRSIDYDSRGRVREIGGLRVSYDIHDRVSQVGDKRISYNIHGRVSQIGDDRVSYDIHDRVSQIGDERISYNIHGRVSQIGDDRVSYDIHDRVSQIGDKRVHYDIHGRVSQIGDDRVDYDISGRVVKGGTNNSFLLYKLIKKYNHK